ncbi:uncharacterized protein [Trachinotus anak]|uniref:uncharacterized protein isoform X2 n=1 Tax=Trachinotus anak TaxID=443729 RepID=UPI0039F1EA5D
MLQNRPLMSPLRHLGLVWLMCGYTSVWAFAPGTKAARKDCSYRKNCEGIQYDIREAVCCKNKLHQEPGLSCCKEKAFNPATATCCEANITLGLSEKVSACCGKEAYSPHNEICCQSTVVTKPVPKAECCGKEALDVDKQLCCGTSDNTTILIRESAHHQCCGHDQFNTKTECCLEINGALKKQQIHSNCCAENSEAFDVDKHICCGPFDAQTILIRNSSRHECCGHGQYDTENECCCLIGGSLKKQPINSSCCTNETGVQLLKPEPPQPKCTEPQTSLCGSSCYNLSQFRCCERNQTKPHWCCSPGQCDAAPTVYDPHTHICCDGCVSERKPWKNQCCGQAPYGLAQRGVLCCNNTLYKDREDGEECSEISIPYNPAKGTICCSQFHGSPGQHCCGTEIYQPHTEMCCNGHRHPKVKNGHCCGIRAYSLTDPHVKCCAGRLYELKDLGKHGHNAQCCGSSLQKPQDVCCSSENEELLYAKRTGFRCCGHLYYNTSLWSCCEGKLSLPHQPQHQGVESKFLSVNNLNKTGLCGEMKIGIVESVSLHSIVFSSVLQIHGTNATVKPLPFPYILTRRGHCNSPKLTPGKTYFFDEVNVFIDFNHDSPLQSLHFIISICNRL